MVQSVASEADAQSPRSSGSRLSGRGRGCSNTTVPAKDKPSTERPAVEPQDRTCGFCGDSDSSENLCPQRHPGVHLRLANRTQCLLCRNFLNGPLRGQEPARVKNELKNKPDKKHEYVEGRLRYAKVFDEHGDTEDVVMPEFVAVTDSVATLGTEVLMNWWPESACKREAVEYKAEDLKPYKEKQELGLWRDAKYTPCTGVIVEAIEKKRKITRRRGLGSSSTAVVANEVGGIYDRLSDRLGGHVI